VSKLFTAITKKLSTLTQSLPDMARSKEKLMKT
jgi:hypothetical protein